MNVIQKRNQALVRTCDQSGLLDRLCTQREARRIRAYYLDGNPLRDISEQEGVTASVVCRSIQRGIQRLKRERGEL